MRLLRSPSSVFVLSAAGVLVLLVGCRPGPPAATPATVIVPTAAAVATTTPTTFAASTSLPPTPTTVATPSAIPTPTLPPPTPTTAPGTATPIAGATLVPATPTAAAGGTGIRPEPGYVDDRSSPEEVLRSYVDALNRKEYARAYSYWETGAAASQLPPFDQFQQGYANTASVQLTLGTIGGGVAAGNLYFDVPVVLNARTTGGEDQAYVGCYRLHLGNPHVQAVPPFRQLAIESATIQAATGGSNPIDRLAQACPDQAGSQTGPGSPTATPNPPRIDPAGYVDDRSGPVEVLRSYVDALNQKEYARAYSYWEAGAAAAQLPPFPQFEQGYAKTQSVQLATGRVTSDPGAGQLHFSVPVVLTATTSDGATQTFVGCYRLHLPRPDLQILPPYQPLAIESATVQQVPTNGNVSALLAQSCH